MIKFAQIIAVFLFLALYQGAGTLFAQTSETTPVEQVADEMSPDPADEFADDPAADEFADDEFDAEFGDVAETEVYDPFEGYNRFMTGVNDKIYVYAFDPLRDGYRWVMPKPVRRGVGNFFENLFFPLRFVNNALQAKFVNTGEETLRFVINSTIGVFGIWDPATEWFKLEKHPEDFGQTLGYWGVGAGPHIVLPVLGPSNLRDTVGLYPENEVDAITLYYRDPNVENAYALDFKNDTVSGVKRSLALTTYRKLNSYSLENIGYQDIKKDALDLYPFLRDAYEQNRNKKIKE